MKINISTGGWLCLWFWLAGYCALLPAQEPGSEVYTGLTDSAAKTKFERTTAGLRIKQRSALRSAHIELERLASQVDLDPPTHNALQQVIERFAQSSDFSMSLEFALQLRRQISASVQPAFDDITATLSEHWVTYQKCKLDYQPTAGRALAGRWPKLSLEQKRCQLADYLALADQRPAWLLRSSPIDNVELVPKTAMSPINQYLGEKNDLIQNVQLELRATIDATIRLAHQESRNEKRSSAERTAAARIAEVLEARYGIALRGVTLCVPSPDLPNNLRIAVQVLLQEFSKKTQQMEPEHERLLRDLHRRLESSQSDRLEQLKLEDQMAIDMHLANITHLIQPMRIFANRSQRTAYYEDARLLKLKQSGSAFLYRVEFMIDGVTQWVDSQQIVTHQTNQLSERMRIDIPSSGPGTAVSNQTDIATGQVFAYSPAGWKPVRVIDESALGVIIRWQGPAEPIEFYFPRSQLRIVEAQ